MFGLRVARLLPIGLPARYIRRDLPIVDRPHVDPLGLGLLQVDIGEASLLRERLPSLLKLLDQLLLLF